jgi:cellulose synthase (UDP-forming)
LSAAAEFRQPEFRQLGKAPEPSLRYGANPGFFFVIGISTAMMIAVAIAPTELESQAIFGALTCATLLVLRRFANRYILLAASFLSMAVSARYVFWRVTQTTAFQSPLEGVFGWMLLLAEIYAVAVLFAGYVQTAWPLRRRPFPLPADHRLWPTVDIFIPTLNEPLAVVRDTIFAAMSLDYPREKLTVYLLDDGRRPEFRRFCEAAGCSYIARPDNKNAKAGNLNNALPRTAGEMIAVFDCDHVPTRSFLRMTVGWLVLEEKLAVVQTPHHFYSPDPFERNLRVERQVPSEGRLFYGLIQDGNDFWNAAIFCGSCAVLRRSALESIGGFAVETVTEDAHSALKMHRAGWNSAYIDVPLAAGLATERFADLVAQRRRWTRGMLQIFRLDNPLFGKGLSLGQRLCYTNATAHFLFAIPRIIFLLAPLAYLILNLSIIRTGAFVLLAFAGPHLFHALFTNAHAQGRYRHSFWNEIYETALAFHLLGPTLRTLINPRAARRFNVTEKGTVLPRDYFDVRLLRPHILACIALVAGIACGVLRWWWGAPPDIRAMILVNLAWAVFNLLVVMAVIHVGRERRQRRHSVRVEAELPATAFFPDGSQTPAWTLNLSKGGGAFRLEDPSLIEHADRLVVRLPCGTRDALFPATVIGASDGILRVAFAPLTLEEEQLLVAAILGRGDAWTAWDHVGTAGPLRSLFRMMGIGVDTVFERHEQLR